MAGCRCFTFARTGLVRHFPSDQPLCLDIRRWTTDGSRTETEGRVMRLVLAVVQSTDVDPLLSDLAALGVSATQIQGDTAVGNAGLAAVVIGVEDDLVSD